MRPHQRLEAEFAKWSGYAPEQMCVCSSGTAALHLALEALRLPEGSRVVVPDFTMVACARAVTLAGLVPLFVDCDERTLLIDPDAVDEACATHDDVRAVMPVHVYGRACDMAALSDLAGKYGLAVVEDLAEAHGVPPWPTSDAACWSFQTSKVITSGEEGGAVAFRDANHARLARRLRNMGFSDEQDYNHIPRGVNARLADCLAERVLESLARVKENLEARRRAEAAYDALCPAAWRMPPRASPWNYDLRVPGLTRARQNAVVKALKEAGIAARHGFKCISWQPEYRETGRVNVGRLPWRAARASLEVFYLPLRPGLVAEDTPAKVFEIIRRHAT